MTCARSWIGKPVSHFVGYSSVGGFGQIEWLTDVDGGIVGRTGIVGG